MAFSLFCYFGLLLVPRFELVLVCDGAHNTARVAHRNYIRRNIFDHHRAATNHYIRANRNARHNLHPSTNPHIIANGDRVGVLQPPVSALGIDGVPGSVETAVGGNKNIVAELYLRTIQNHCVVVGKEVLANLDIIAVVAPERGYDAETIARSLAQ